MKKLWNIVLLVSLLGSTQLTAKEVKKGSLSVLVFSNGKPLIANEVKVDGKDRFQTDSDGSVQTRLTVGKHQLEIFGKDAEGISLGYFKKPVEIVEGQDTQVIATLSKTGADTIDIDVPVKSDVVAVKKVEVTGTGTLLGRVLSSEGNKPIAGARIFVRGTSVDVRTDANGRFSATIPAGKKLSISVVHSAYSAQTVGGISVKANAKVSRTVKLTPASMELEEFVVLAPKVEGSIADILQEEKKVNAITNILGSEEMSKKGDSDAASALKRVSGVTLIGGKSVFVRGLGDRYANVELNSLPLPSPDPTKRVVPLDLFPVNAIGSMVVQKSATADIPSNFGGGYINMRTRNDSQKNFYRISFSLKADSTVGSSALDYQGGGLDFLGLDDGYREIPSYIQQFANVVPGERVKNFTTKYFTPEQLLQMDKDFIARNVAISRAGLPMGGSVALEGAHTFNINEENALSVYMNYKYNQEHHMRNEHFYKYDFSLADGSMTPQADSEGTNELRQSEYSHSAMFNAAYNYFDVLNIRYLHLLSHVGQKTARTTDGQFGSNSTFFVYHYLDWEERTLNTDQVVGDFDYEIFKHKSNFEFGLEYATAQLSQPNNFLYLYSVGTDGTNYLNNGTTNLLSKRLYSLDSVYALYLKNKTELDIVSKDDYLLMGLNVSQKTRTSEYQKFYLDQENTTRYEVNDIDALLNQYVRNWTDPNNRNFALNTLFEPADYFDANVNDLSVYTNLFMKPREDIETLLGVRFVTFSQVVDQYAEDSTNPDFTQRRNITKFSEELELSDVFPSISVKYKYDDANHFDFATSKTYIVPDLREFTSGTYFHPFEVATVVGNPNLKNTDIYSVDLKYSHYLSDDEYIKTGVFYKYLIDPIEDIQIPSSSLPIFSFDNTDSAVLYGIELDGRKSLDFIGENFKPFYVSGNFSYTDSDVTLRADQETEFSTNHRQLQGLSNYVFNATLGYDADARSVSLSFNYMGERIRKVGLIEGTAQNGEYIRFPDTIEIPPKLLDFVWRENFANDYVLNFKAKNLLDSEVVWTYGGKEINRFQYGSQFSLGISKKF